MNKEITVIDLGSYTFQTGSLEGEFKPKKGTYVKWIKSQLNQNKDE